MGGDDEYTYEEALHDIRGAIIVGMTFASVLSFVGGIIVGWRLF